MLDEELIIESRQGLVWINVWETPIIMHHYLLLYLNASVDVLMNQHNLHQSADFSINNIRMRNHCRNWQEREGASKNKKLFAKFEFVVAT